MRFTGVLPKTRVPVILIGIFSFILINFGCGGGGGDPMPAPSQVANVDGNWNVFHTDTGVPDEKGPDVLAINQSGSNFTFTLYYYSQGGSYSGNGTVTGSRFDISWTDYDGYSITATGTVNGDTITGSWYDNGGGSGTWRAVRVANSDFSGSWNAYHTTIGVPGERGPDRLQVNQSDSNVTFNIYFKQGGSSTGTGTINGDHFTASWTDADGCSVSVEGTVNGDTATGTWSDNGGQSGIWRAERSSTPDNQGLYNVYGGNVYISDVAGYDPVAHGYTLLGTASFTKTFFGNFDYYLIGSQNNSTVRVDTVQGSNGNYYQTFTTGNTEDYLNIGGPPDGAVAIIGHTNPGHEICGYILIDARNDNLTSITVIQ